MGNRQSRIAEECNWTIPPENAVSSALHRTVYLLRSPHSVRAGISEKPPRCCVGQDRWSRPMPTLRSRTTDHHLAGETARLDLAPPVRLGDLDISHKGLCRRHRKRSRWETSPYEMTTAGCPQRSSHPGRCAQWMSIGVQCKEWRHETNSFCHSLQEFEGTTRAAQIEAEPVAPILKICGPNRSYPLA